jgi:hypothetical protein
LAFRIGSFFTIGTISAAANHFSGFEKVPSASCRRELDDRDVLLLELGSELQVAGGDDHACVGVFTVFTGWFCMKLYVPYANPPPARMAMARTAKIRLRIGSPVIHSASARMTASSGERPRSSCFGTRRATGPITMNWNG